MYLFVSGRYVADNDKNTSLNSATVSQFACDLKLSLRAQNNEHTLSLRALILYEGVVCILLILVDSYQYITIWDSCIWQTRTAVSEVQT